MMRKTRVDSTAGIVNSFKETQQTVDLPDGVILRSEEEMTIWRQFTNVRAPSDWRDFDLLLIAKAVRLEADIRKYQTTIDKTGPLITNKRETYVENPLLRVIDTLQRQQLAIVRAMSLNQTSSDPRTLNDNGMKQKQVKEVMGEFSIESLIAMPDQAQ
jgi:hypothetical protein